MKLTIGLKSDHKIEAVCYSYSVQQAALGENFLRFAFRTYDEKYNEVFVDKNELAYFSAIGSPETQSFLSSLDQSRRALVKQT